MSLDLNTNKEKAIKELELIAKKIKKRMNSLNSDDILSNNKAFVELSTEYRQVKESIIRIIQA